jgi:signal peptidase II
VTARGPFLRAGLVAAAVIVVDQLSKSVASSGIERGSRIELLGPLKLTLSHNDGVAFGLAGGGGVLVIGLSMIALVALGAFVASAPHRKGIWLAAGLIFGGAVGNLIDRVRLGHVVDFILLPGWPAFNFADCAITVGVVLLTWSLVRDDRGNRNRDRGTEGPAPEKRDSTEVAA